MINDEPYVLGMDLYNQGEYERAIPFLERASGSDVEIPETLAFAYLKKPHPDYGSAVKAFSRALRTFDAELYPEISSQIYKSLSETFDLAGNRSAAEICSNISGILKDKPYRERTDETLNTLNQKLSEKTGVSFPVYTSPQ